MRKNLLLLFTWLIAMIAGYTSHAQSENLNRFNTPYPNLACDTLRTDIYSAPDWNAEYFIGYQLNANRYPTAISTYDDNQKLVTRWRFTRNSSDLVTKAEFDTMYPMPVGIQTQRMYTLTYNGNKQLIGQTLENLSSLSPPAFTNSERTTFTYNGDGNIEAQILETWDNSNKQWNTETKFAFNYDSKKRLGNIMTLDYNGGVWDTLYRTEFTVNSNDLPSAKIFRAFQTGQTYVELWREYYKYNNDDEHVQTLYQEFDMSAGWMDVRLDSIRAYNQLQSWMWDGGQWVPSSRTVCSIGGGFPPLPPKNLVADAKSSSRIDLTWTDASIDEEGFIIQRDEAGSGSWITVDTIGANATSYSDVGLQPVTTYTYRVAAFNTAGKSAWSDWAIEVTIQQGNAPAAPSGLKITMYAGFTMADLQWQDNSGGATIATGFNVYRTQDTTSSWQLVGSPANAHYVDGPLGGAYWYKVSATNANGESYYSNTAKADFVVGVEPFANNNVVSSVYPNPASNKLNIQLKENAGLTNIRIVDLSGKNVLTRSAANTTAVSLDLSDIAKGIYMLEVRSSSGVHSQKLIVE